MSYTMLDKLRLSGQDLILKWVPGESRKLRVIEPKIYINRRHWVETRTDTGEKRRVPVPCLGDDCHRIKLPSGESLHDLEVEEEFRVLCWSFELGELRILAGKRQIFGPLQDFARQFGDITKFDVLVKCVASSGLGGRKYEVTAVPTGAYELPEEALERILADWKDAMVVISPKPATTAEVLAKIPGATETEEGDEKALPAPGTAVEDEQ